MESLRLSYSNLAPVRAGVYSVLDTSAVLLAIRVANWPLWKCVRIVPHLPGHNNLV